MSAFTKAASATCAVGAVAFSVLAGGMSASAAPVDCAAMGATTVAPGICQIVVTTSGTFSIGAPVGVTVTHLEALLVAGGSAGSGFPGYAGGFGGEVVYVDNLPLTPLTVTIGAGGTTSGSSAAGTPTVVTDGTTTFTEAEPAELEDPADPDTGTYNPSINGVNGVLPSAFVATANPASTLFPSYTGEQYLAGDGVDGDEVNGDAPWILATDHTPAGGGQPGTFATARANSGSGGGGGIENFDDGYSFGAGDGAAGVVIFRFAAPEAPAAAAAALAATGSDASTATAVAGVLLLGGTAALIAGQRRRARA